VAKQTRKTKTGRDLIILDKPVTISIKTKVPSKYMLIDTETGEIYLGNSSGAWTKFVKDKKDE
jgi:hypothetical protein